MQSAAAKAASLAMMAAAIPKARGVDLPELSRAEWAFLSPLSGGIETSHTSVESDGQKSTYFTKNPLEPIIKDARDADDHFAQCLHLNFPGEAHQAESLTAAAKATCAAPDLRQSRQDMAAIITKVAERSSSASEKIKENCHPMLRKALGKTNVMLLMIMTVALSWPDNIVKDLTEGFRVTGHINPSGVYPTRETAETIPQIQEGASESNSGIHNALKQPSSEQQRQDCQIIKESCIKLQEQGRASQFVKKETLDKRYGKDGWRSMKRFVVWQNGKPRCCDDARRSGHNAAVTISDRLILPSPFYPAEAATALLKQDNEMRAEDLCSGCEDLKSAYMIIPIHPDHYRWNIIAIWDPDEESPRYLEARVALFGTASSVPSFNRIPALLTAIGRRILHLPIDFYVDDCCLVDMQRAKGSGQMLLRTLFDACGLEYAKSQQMATETTFLGISHRFQEGRRMTFWPTEDFCASILSAIQRAETSNYLSPGEAAKLRGRTTWLTRATFNKVGRACSGPLAAREFHHSPPWTLNDQLKRTFTFIKAVLDTAPRKEVALGRRAKRPIILATDGRDARGEGKGDQASLAYLAIDLEDNSKVAGYAEVTKEDRKQWQCKKTHIAQIELAAVINFILRHRRLIRDRDIIVFNDNANAIAAMVNNSSTSPDTSEMACWLHFALFQSNCNAWFEWVPSELNWSDSASRGNFDWAAANGWEIQAFNLANWESMADNIFADIQE